MSEQSLSEKIAALPAEERAARYLQVVREQGLSMATQKRCLDEKDETIASLRQRVADLTPRLPPIQHGEGIDMDHPNTAWAREEAERVSALLTDALTQNEEVKIIESALLAAERRAKEEERAACLLDVAAEEELNGKPPHGMVERIVAHPVEALRAAVRTTKRGITDRIKSRSTLPPTSKAE